MEYTPYDSICGDSGSVSPVGCMMCLWCDTPSASYSSTEAANVASLIETFAANNPDVFDLTGGTEGGGTESGGTEGGGTVEGLPTGYAGAVESTTTQGGTVYVLDTDGVDAGSNYLIVAPSNPIALSYVMGWTSYSPSTYSVTITDNVATAASPTVWTINSSGQIKSGDVYVRNASNIISTRSTNWTITHNGDGQYQISNTRRYLCYNNGEFGRSTTSSTVRLFKETTTTGGTAYTVGRDGINALIADTKSLYDGNNANGYAAELWSDFVTAYTAAKDAVDNTFASYETEAAANTQQLAVNTAAKTLYDAWQALKAESVVLTVKYVCGSSTIDTDEFLYGKGASATVSAKDISGYIKAGTTSYIVTMDGDQTVTFYRAGHQDRTDRCFHSGLRSDR